MIYSTYIIGINTWMCMLARKPVGRAIASASGIHTGEPDPVEYLGHQHEGPLDMAGLSADQNIYIYTGVVCGNDVVYATTQTGCCWMAQTDSGKYTMFDASSDLDQPGLSECGWIDLLPHDVP